MSEGLQSYFEGLFGELETLLIEEELTREHLVATQQEIARRTQKIAQVASTCEEDLNPRSLAARLVREMREGGLSEAIRNIYKAAKAPLSAVDVHTQLKAINYPLGSYKNVLATLHLTINRLHDQGELIATTEAGKKAFTWNRKQTQRPRWAEHLAKTQDALKPITGFSGASTPDPSKIELLTGKKKQ